MLAARLTDESEKAKRLPHQTKSRLWVPCGAGQRHPGRLWVPCGAGQRHPGRQTAELGFQPGGAEP
eukprot:280051-Chlamydomonas_euryale.AAC.4